MRTGWAVVGVVGLVFAACGGDGGPPPGPSNGSAGSAGAAGAGAGGGGGRAGNRGTAGGSSGDAGTAGSGGTAGTAAAAGMGGVDDGSGAGDTGGTGTGGAGDTGGTGAGGAGDIGGAGTCSADDVVGTEGGTVSDAAGNLTLIIPPGALAGDTRFAFTDVPLPSGLPTELDFAEGVGHEVAWSLPGFTQEGSMTARIRVPEAELSTSDQAFEALELPYCMAVKCADGTWATSGCIVIHGGTLDLDVAPLCREAGPVTFVVTTPNSSALAPSTTDPASVTVAAGDPAAFSAVASGSPAPWYQWRRNGTDIPGATSATYTLDVTYPSDSGAAFSVRVTNFLGSVTSAEGVLTVGAPRTPRWSTVTPLNAFAAEVDTPQTGSLTGLDFAVWNEAGSLRGSSPYAPINTLAEPARSRPRVVTGGSLSGGFIAFVDDSGSNCASPSGNRLSAVAVRIGSQGESYPLSSRFTLYESATDCIAQFSAALIDTGAAAPRPLAFAVTEASSGALKVGAGGAVYQSSTSSWAVTEPALSTLTLDAACSGSAVLTEESLAGRRQAFLGTVVPTTTAVLTWVANENLCAATLDGGSWSSGSVVFDRAIGDPSIGPPEPVAIIDGDGKALVVASRVVDPAVTPATQAMTAAFRGASGGPWEVDALDTSAALAAPSAAFTSPSSTRPENAQFAGSALVVWRPSLPAAPTTVYAAVRSPSGTWTSPQPISAVSAADTRFPRICVDSAGNAVAVYQEKASASDPFQVWGRLWSGGAWSAPGRVQNNTNEGRFADCVKHESNSFLRDGVFVAWRETNPSAASEFRIVTATP